MQNFIFYKMTYNLCIFELFSVGYLNFFENLFLSNWARLESFFLIIFFYKCSKWNSLLISIYFYILWVLIKKVIPNIRFFEKFERGYPLRIFKKNQKNFFFSKITYSESWSNSKTNGEKIRPIGVITKKLWAYKT